MNVAVAIVTTVTASVPFREIPTELYEKLYDCRCDKECAIYFDQSRSELMMGITKKINKPDYNKDNLANAIDEISKISEFCDVPKDLWRYEYYDDHSSIPSRPKFIMAKGSSADSYMCYCGIEIGFSYQYLFLTNNGFLFFTCSMSSPLDVNVNASREYKICERKNFTRSDVDVVIADEDEDKNQVKALIPVDIKPVRPTK